MHSTNCNSVCWVNDSLEYLLYLSQLPTGTIHLQSSTTNSFNPFKILSKHFQIFTLLHFCWYPWYPWLVKSFLDAFLQPKFLVTIKEVECISQILKSWKSSSLWQEGSALNWIGLGISKSHQTFVQIKSTNIFYYSVLWQSGWEKTLLN